MLQEYRIIPFNKNEANKSIFTSKKIDPNAIETIKKITSEETEKVASKQNEIIRNNTAYTPHLKSYLDSLPISSLTTKLGKFLRTAIASWTGPTI